MLLYTRGPTPERSLPTKKRRIARNFRRIRLRSISFSRSGRRFWLRRRPRQPSTRREPMLFRTRRPSSIRFGGARGDFRLGASLCCLSAIKRRFARSFRRFKRRNGVFPAAVDVFGFGGARGNPQLGASLCCFIPAARRQKGHSQRKGGVSLGTFADLGAEASLFPRSGRRFLLRRRPRQPSTRREPMLFHTCHPPSTRFGGARGDSRLGASLFCFTLGGKPGERLRPRQPRHRITRFRLNETSKGSSNCCHPTRSSPTPTQI